MSVVKEELLVKGEKKEKELSILFDSGSARSLIKGKVAKEFAEPRDLPASVEVKVADGHKVRCKQYCNLVIEIKGKRIIIQPNYST